MVISRQALRIIAASSLVLGAVPYSRCVALHDCMGGHMQHGPYPPIDLVGDGLWAGLFVLAAVTYFISRGGLRYPTAVFLVGLVALKFGGGQLGCIDVYILVLVVLLYVAKCFGVKREVLNDAAPDPPGTNGNL